MSFILDDAQIEQLTQRKRRPAQRRVLDAIGVSYRVRPDGSIVIFTEQFHAAPAQNRPPSPRLRLS